MSDMLELGTDATFGTDLVTSDSYVIRCTSQLFVSDPFISPVNHSAVLHLLNVLSSKV